MILPPVDQRQHVGIPVLGAAGQRLAVGGEQVGFTIAPQALQRQAARRAPIAQELNAAMRVHAVDEVTQHEHLGAVLAVDIVQHRPQADRVSVHVRQQSRSR